jgi:transcriptional regulator of heat shock response
MKPEILFLKYAFPCSFVLLSRGEITEEEHKLIYKSAKEEKMHLPKERIEKIFWRAVEHVKNISDLNSVQEYWQFNHNKKIKVEKFKSIPKDLIKECFVIPCEIVSVSNSHAVVKSEFLDKIVRVKKDFVNIRIGDKATKHYDYLCEKIPENLYIKIVESFKKII